MPCASFRMETVRLFILLSGFEDADDFITSRSETRHLGAYAFPEKLLYHMLVSVGYEVAHLGYFVPIHVVELLDQIGLQTFHQFVDLLYRERRGSLVRFVIEEVLDVRPETLDVIGYLIAEFYDESQVSMSCLIEEPHIPGYGSAEVFAKGPFAHDVDLCPEGLL